MSNGSRRARLAVWWLLVLVLLSALISGWRALSGDAEHTALALAKLRITEQANRYKQQWILQGRPQQLHIGQDWIAVQHGWLFPTQDHRVDCHALLALLNPQRQILAQMPSVMSVDFVQGYRCTYQYGASAQLSVELSAGHFVVDLNL